MKLTLIKFIGFYLNLGLALCMSLAIPNIVSAQTWIELSPTGPPPPVRVLHSAVYNPANNRMTVFAGLNGGGFVGVEPPLNDVWVLENADGQGGTPNWIQLSPTGGPPIARVAHSAVYDPGSNRMTVFGGNPSFGFCGGAINDVWVLEHADGLGGAPHWIPLFPDDAPPSVRYQHSAVYDPGSNRMIVFGGNNPCVPGDNQVWVLTHANGLDITTGLPATPQWIRLNPTGTLPPASSFHVAGYDPASNRLTAFGGNLGVNVWMLENANGLEATPPKWTQLSPTGGPPTTQMGRGVYDPTTNRIIAFGGVFTAGPSENFTSNDVWLLENANGLDIATGLPAAPQWIQLSPAVPGPLRNFHSLILNAGNERMTMFGGHRNTDLAVFNDTWVLTVVNAPPTAEAGANQSIRAGDTAVLDGSDSFDDNTAAVDLGYSWSFFAAPAGSSAMLTGADTSSPSFVADLPGTYVVELVVTDEGGLDSAPDQVQVSSDNLAPTAAAGEDQLVIVGTTTLLDGSTSSDPEGDPLTYSWTLTSTPAGSTATVIDASAVAANLTPDLEGVYEVTLEVSDFIGAGAPDTAVITAATAEDFAEIEIVSASDVIAILGPDEVTTQGNQNALSNFLSQAVVAIQKGDTAKAIDKLDKAIARTDGCILRGAPDGNGPGRDWITECAAQVEVYDRLTAARDALL